MSIFNRKRKTATTDTIDRGQTIMNSQTTKYNYSAFTLVELLVALMVTGIILAAVATFTFALGAVNDSSNDTIQKQAQIRSATIRVSELIRHCKLVCSKSTYEMAVWKADYNDDNKINANELVYIELSDKKDYIRLLEFTPYWWFGNSPITIQSIKSGAAKAVLNLVCKKNYTNLITKHSNATFLVDAAAPWTKFVSLSVGMEENGTTHNYQINASLRAGAYHLLDGSGEIK